RGEDCADGLSHNVQRGVLSRGQCRSDVGYQHLQGLVALGAEIDDDDLSMPGQTADNGLNAADGAIKSGDGYEGRLVVCFSIRLELNHGPSPTGGFARRDSVRARTKATTSNNKKLDEARTCRGIC